MTHADSRIAQPLLIEIGEADAAEALARVAPWLAITAAVQSAFRQMLEDTAPNVKDAYLHKHFNDVVLPVARAHEQRMGELYTAFDQQPPDGGVLGSAAAAAMAKTRQAAGQVEGLAGGAHAANWRSLRELLLTNLDAISGFAVAEQLGLALGRPQVVAITFPIVQEKTEHQLFLREAFLEMAPLAILYRRDL